MLVSPIVQFDRLLDAEEISRCSPCEHRSGRLDHAAIGARAAVADRRFVGIEFDNGIVDAEPGKG